jgi:hypothetical protein
MPRIKLLDERTIEVTRSSDESLKTSIDFAASREKLLVVTVIEIDGTQIVPTKLIIGDTHLIWIQHQTVVIPKKPKKPRVSTGLTAAEAEAASKLFRLLAGESTVRPSGVRIFISYRRADKSLAAQLLRIRLPSHFGTESVFMDDGIPVGDNFVERLHGELKKCNCLLAVIGDGWLDARIEDGPRKGERRLDGTDDFVRIEIQSALARRIPIIPVLVGGAIMPRAQELPEALQKLASINATEVRTGRDIEIDSLIRAIQVKLDAKS